MIEFKFAFIVLAIVNIGLCEVIHLSCEEIKTLVDGHNNRRQLIASGKVRGQPAASNMKYMKWDEELAAKAEEWAANGVFVHNPDKEVASRRFQTGENLLTITSTRYINLNLDELLDHWFTEHEYYTFGPMSMEDFLRRPDRQIGHYTQMVWADTTHVGCGLSKSQDHYYTRFLLVCNYGPSGNYIGLEPYERSRQRTRLIGNEKQLYGESC